MEAASEKEAMKILHVSAGEGHTLALTGNGCIYAWGRGLFGRLGTGNDSDELIPLKIPIKRLKQEDQLDVKIVGIAAGAYHNLALSGDGLVWSWGYNVYGQLGREDEMSSIPCPIDEVVQEGSEEITTANTKRDNGKRVLEATVVKAGGMMSLAIDRCGTLWIWGHCPLPSSEKKR
uniref:Regulator of chromosome condensation 1/beta-lactamase-inhibitor protein II n=1 Tax=Araucaria cunninghamii TaxID=56994 RepID=A0A0D6R6F2_ARACU